MKCIPVSYTHLGFYKYYKKIIEAILENSNLDIHYVTCDPNDAVFEMNNPRIIPYYVDNTKPVSYTHLDVYKRQV